MTVPAPTTAESPTPEHRGNALGSTPFAILDYVPTGVFCLDAGFKVIFWNRMLAEWSGIPADHIRGRSIGDFFPHMTDSRYVNRLRLVFEHGQPAVFSSQLHRQIIPFANDTPHRTQHTVVTPCPAESGPGFNALFTIEEVTDLRLLAEDLKGLLKEKDVLLKEIHHRVKNNLQVIASLLSLQQDYVGNEEAAERFRESKNRVKTMALIHDKLYCSARLSEVDFPSYLTDLVDQVFCAYAVDRRRIQPVVDCEPCRLGVDKAIPCGLVVNELVSNALKYAFPGDRAGRVTVRFARAAKQWVLTVADDGVGFPPEIVDHPPKTLGIHLVKLLATQLGGRLEFTRTEGGSFTISFL